MRPADNLVILVVALLCVWGCYQLGLQLLAWVRNQWVLQCLLGCLLFVIVCLLTVAGCSFSDLLEVV